MTKNIPPERIQEAFEAGARDFGENRVQELLQKKPHLSSEIRWHFVGHLQTNKVKSLIGETALIHSLDCLELAEEIQKQAEKSEKRGLAPFEKRGQAPFDVLLQVNTTGEATKSGFSPNEVEEALEKIRSLNRIQVRGLMTIGPTPDVGVGPPAYPWEGQPQGVVPTNKEEVRSSFRCLRVLREELRQKFPSVNLEHLSMGMSSDFEMAIEEGATMVRIGTAVFGERR